MKRIKMLVLTDHSTHSKENSLYALLRALKAHRSCEYIDVASRGNEINDGFFHSLFDTRPFVTRVTEDFAYHEDGRCFLDGLRRTTLKEYDVIFLRLPHPTPVEFWSFLRTHFPERRIFNRPSGIERSSSKAFLLEVSSLCPPIKLCKTPEDILEFKSRFPIVLKPLRGYGGSGIIKIEGDQAWMGNQEIDLDNFLNTLKDGSEEYLAMKYLKNVDQGDKRIVVINGKTFGASLRLPADGSWLCNSAKGGRSVATTVEPEEKVIGMRLASVLSKMGVMFFGFDTLVDDNGKRVLSEVNTMSIGGLKQIDNASDEPLLMKAAGWVWDYAAGVIEQKTIETNGKVSS